jgi:crossover junction endodeoxyribonuclease RuvC
MRPVVSDAERTRAMKATPQNGYQRALGIDPGLAATGYALVQATARGGALSAWGSLKTSPRTPLPERLQILHRGVTDLIRQWNPALMVIEEVYVLETFPKAALVLGQVLGVVSLAAQEHAVTILQLRPTEVKAGLTGNGRASKDHVKRAVKRMLGVSVDISPDHASDAAALALLGLSRKGYCRW